MLPVIVFHELPRQGRTFEGELRQDIFGLTGDQDPRFEGPLEYSLTVRLDGADIIVEGRLSAKFLLPCTRCGRRLPWQVELDPYLDVEPREGADSLDLTAQVREDILLALPGYPRCEDSNVDPRPCPAAGRFAPASAFVPLDDPEVDTGPRPSPWEELEHFQPGDPPPPNR